VSKQIQRTGSHFVYILQCSNGTYYTGYTKNIENRIKEHNNKHGVKYLKGRLPVKLVYVKEYRYYKNALNRERNIKKMTRKQKEELIRVYNENNT